MIINKYEQFINEARASLPFITQKAIDSIDWKKVVHDIALSRKYSIDQVEYLEIDTELLVYLTISTEKYIKTLSEDMKISTGESKFILSEIEEKILIPMAEYVRDHRSQKSSNLDRSSKESAKESLRQMNNLNPKDTIRKLLDEIKAEEKK